MIRKVIAIALLVAFVQCELEIVSPKELNKSLGIIPYSLANYGNIPYGHTFVGTIAISNPLDGCSDIDEIDFESNEDSGKDESKSFDATSSPVYLIKRGNCPFVVKSRHAEEANGKVVIIFNDRPNESVNDIILMDSADHSGKGLMISTVFITKPVGEAIMSYLAQHETEKIVVKFKFQRPAGGDKNKIKFWMSSMDIASYEFLKNFYTHYQDLLSEKIDIEFSPHYVTQQDKDENKQKEHCISKGKYCTPEYKVGGVEMYSRDVILEDIRQLILYEISPNLWWQYVFEFKTQCVETQETEIEECSTKVLEKIKASPQQLNTLKTKFEQSFTKVGGKIDYGVSENSIMEKEYEKQYSAAVSILPTLIFNGKYFRGDVTSNSAIYEFICAKFTEAPESCYDSYKEWIEFKNKKIHRESSSGGSSMGVILLVVFGILIMVFLILFLYRRMVRKEMSDTIGVQVNSAISNYFALNDTQTSKSKK